MKNKIINRVIIFALLVIANLTVAQSDTIFLSGFLQGDPLRSENKIEDYKDFDFSKMWSNTPNDNVYGIIGDEHQRLHIKLISINKQSSKPTEYFVQGKSMVKDQLREFSGTIHILEVREVVELHYGVDEEFKDKGIKKQGILIAEYYFEENLNEEKRGIFKGILYSKWYLNKKNKIQYDDIEISSDSYSNNAFIGIWKCLRSEKEKTCNWGDYRVPKANQDFDIGAAEFSVSHKYVDQGWLDVILKNKIPNGAIKEAKSGRNNLIWWK